MRAPAFLAPFAAVALAAAAAVAQPASVDVTVGADLGRKAAELGDREVREQADRLATVVSRALADTPELAGARIDLVLTDLKPNRPTAQQTIDRPGLDPIRSISIGGAAVEGVITTADGRTLPVRYEWFSSNLGDVRGVGPWSDAERAYYRLAANLEAGRYVQR